MAELTEFVILAHGGAGAPNQEVMDQRRRACTRATKLGREALETERYSALDIAVLIVAEMENAPPLIAGLGSGPNQNGEYQFDASVATGDGRTGAVGAVGRLRNPVFGALQVYHSPAELIVGSDATQYAIEHGLTEHSQERFEQDYRNGAEAQYGIFDPTKPHPEPDKSCDTVGAIVAMCWDGEWEIACASSTGGMPDKIPGRVGDTALNGSGFRVKQILDTLGRQHLSGALVSGVGEASIRNLTAGMWVHAAQLGNTEILTRGLPDIGVITEIANTTINGANAWGALIGLDVVQELGKPSRIEGVSLWGAPYFPTAWETNSTHARLSIRTTLDSKSPCDSKTVGSVHREIG